MYTNHTRTRRRPCAIAVGHTGSAVTIEEEDNVVGGCVGGSDGGGCGCDCGANGGGVGADEDSD